MEALSPLFSAKTLTTMPSSADSQSGPPHTLDPIRCSVCGRTEPPLKKCSRCLVACYCSKDCQKADWMRHKWECLPHPLAVGAVNGNGHITISQSQVSDFTPAEPQERSYSDKHDKSIAKPSARKSKHRKGRNKVKETRKEPTNSSNHNGKPAQKTSPNRTTSASEPSAAHTLTHAHQQPSSHFRPSSPPHTSPVGEAAEPNLDIKTLISYANSSDPNKQLLATKQFRRLLSEPDPPIAEIVATGLVPRFIEFIQRSDQPKLQFEASWVVTNICSGTSDNTQAVIDSGGIPVLIKMLSCHDIEIAESCVWALGNIAGDSPAAREMVIRSGVLEGLVPLTRSYRLSLLRNVAWTMTNLCQTTDREFARACVPILARLLNCFDKEVLTDACYSLSYISNDNIGAVISGGVCGRLVELLTHCCPSVQNAALITIGNIVTGDDEETQAVLDHPVLPRLLKLLGHKKKKIRKNAIFTISNITAGTKDQIQAVIDAGILPAVIKMLRSDEDTVDAVWTLSNAMSNGSEEQIEYIIQLDCLRPLCDLLVTQPDTKVVEQILETLRYVLLRGRKYLEWLRMAKCREKLLVLNKLRGGADSALARKIASVLELLAEVERAGDTDAPAVAANATPQPVPQVDSPMVLVSEQDMALPQPAAAAVSSAPQQQQSSPAPSASSSSSSSSPTKPLAFVPFPPPPDPFSHPIPMHGANDVTAAVAMEEA